METANFSLIVATQTPLMEPRFNRKLNGIALQLACTHK